VADDVQVIECSKCGRLHEIDPETVGKTIECDCGQTLTPRPDGSHEETDGDSVGVAEAAAGGNSLVGRLKSHWKLTLLVSAGIVCMLVFVALWRGPSPTLANLQFDGRGGASKGSEEDPEIYLRILEDNSRADEHDGAAAKLVRMHSRSIVPRLCQMARRRDLVSRLLVIGLLGQKQEEQALEVLGELMDGPDMTLGFAAVTAVARIGGPMSESMLRGLIRTPGRARQVLPSIAAVRNDVAARVLRAALDDPSLRMLAMDEIGKTRAEGCVSALVRLAMDRTIIEVDRVKAVETLGLLRSVKARRALIGLSEDGNIGWKARQVLDQGLGL